MSSSSKKSIFTVSLEASRYPFLVGATCGGVGFVE